MSASGLVISRNEIDGVEVTHFRITEINGGDLFLNDGTSPIANDKFITVAEGQKGLKFKPSGETGGSFKVFAAVGDAGDKLSKDFATARIYSLGAPDIAISGKKGEPSVVTIKPNKADTSGVTHFKISNVKGGALTKSDGAAIPDPPFINIDEGKAGLKFTPEDAAKGGSFDVQSSTSALEAGVAGSEPATATIIAKPVGGER
jgi:hypothetical protein